MQINKNKAFSILYILFGLIAFLPLHSYADSPRNGDTATKIIYANILDGHDGIQMAGQRVRFALRGNLPPPACAHMNCARANATNPPKAPDEQQPAQAEDGK